MGRRNLLVLHWLFLPSTRKRTQRRAPRRQSMRGPRLQKESFLRVTLHNGGNFPRFQKNIAQRKAVDGENLKLGGNHE